MSESAGFSVIVLCEIIDLDRRVAERPDWAGEKAERDLDWMQVQGEKTYGRPIGRDARTLWMAFEDPGSAMTYATGLQDGLVMEAREMDPADVLEYRIAMATGHVAEDASLEPAAIATLYAMLAGAESADIVMTGIVHEIVEPILFTPAELGSSLDVPGHDQNVELFYLRSDKPVEPGSMRQSRDAPEPPGLAVEAPVARDTEPLPEISMVPEPVAPADFAAAGEVLKPKPVRPDAASLIPRRKTTAAPATTADSKPVVFQRIRADRAACSVPYGRAFLAVRDALRRGKIKIVKEDTADGRFDIKTSWFGKRPVYVTRHGIAYVVTVDKPGESKVPAKAAKLIDLLCAEPVPAEALDPAELTALRDTEPTPRKVS